MSIALHVIGTEGGVFKRKVVLCHMKGKDNEQRLISELS